MINVESKYILDQ